MPVGLQPAAGPQAFDSVFYRWSAVSIESILTTYRINRTKFAFNQPVAEFALGKNMEHEGKVLSVFTIEKPGRPQTKLV
jgi:hypothetical protein